LRLRQYAIILLFLAACTALSLLSYLGHFNNFGSDQAIPVNGPKHDEIEESYFRDAHFFSVTNNRPSLQFQSNELSLSNIDGVVIAFDPSGIIYRYEKNGEELEPIYFRAKNSRTLLNKKEIYLDNDVEINLSSTSLKAQKMIIISSGEILYANHDVKTFSTIIKTNDQISITAQGVVYRPKDQFFEYKQQVEGIIRRKKSYEESISFKTDLLSLEAPKSLASMKGNVIFKKDNLEASANRGDIFLENYNKRLKYYALYDDVRLQERLTRYGKPFLRKAFSEKLEGLMSEKRMILTGLPKVFQDKDVIKGNRIIIRENVETVEVDDANTSIILENK